MVITSITKEFLKENLECSDMYSQKMIEWAQGDDKKLYELFIQKRVERNTRQAMKILEVD
ncbi:hypothetical protein [Staphylococcus pseudintermedius]|uniref:hypothetical protein n=1 Tax=Staphylococcus pseudintermedius TaxID=283734 RepID=UPI000BBC3556|nr:hypothetical protein [Staphylococcus pseudintermedius]EGQ3375401.1 hypothetical protein [Staphylococcus pseudintermedius]MBM0304122.1 hypothetical protein [Staphylococcus pseudintermedius]MDU9262152.1 hypothetical protein [Staphylococcus pseudintermedius]PCE56525.1 hypothetical protein BSR35_07735 [Staphylococcus pseudintermedius]PWZ91519.1 hypothetical protein DD879_01900 [Staphylococcus pseudintermedius]